MVDGEIFHLGFSDMEALYCSSCLSVLLIRHYFFSGNVDICLPNIGPEKKGWEPYNKHLLPYYNNIEELFKNCDCGGSYRFMNHPRCPKCNNYMRGNCYEDKPILKQRDLYLFVCCGSVDAKDHLK